MRRNDRKHGIHNRPQRREPYRENKGPRSGDEQVQVKSKRVRHDAELSPIGFCNRTQLGVSPHYAERAA